MILIKPSKKEAILYLLYGLYNDDYTSAVFHFPLVSWGQG